MAQAVGFLSSKFHDKRQSMVGASACVYPQLDWFWVGGKVRCHIGVWIFLGGDVFRVVRAANLFAKKAAWAQRSDLVDRGNRAAFRSPVSLAVRPRPTR